MRSIALVFTLGFFSTFFGQYAVVLHGNAEKSIGFNFYLSKVKSSLVNNKWHPDLKFVNENAKSNINLSELSDYFYEKYPIDYYKNNLNATYVEMQELVDPNGDINIAQTFVKWNSENEYEVIYNIKVCFQNPVIWPDDAYIKTIQIDVEKIDLSLIKLKEIYALKKNFITNIPPPPPPPPNLYFERKMKEKIND